VGARRALSTPPHGRRAIVQARPPPRAAAPRHRRSSRGSGITALAISPRARSLGDLGRSRVPHPPVLEPHAGGSSTRSRSRSPDIATARRSAFSRSGRGLLAPSFRLAREHDPLVVTGDFERRSRSPSSVVRSRPVAANRSRRVTPSQPECHGASGRLLARIHRSLHGPVLGGRSLFFRTRHPSSRARGTPRDANASARLADARASDGAPPRGVSGWVGARQKRFGPRPRYGSSIRRACSPSTPPGTCRNAPPSCHPASFDVALGEPHATLGRRSSRARGRRPDLSPLLAWLEQSGRLFVTVTQTRTISWTASSS